MQLKPMRLAGIHLYSQGLPAEDRGLTGVNVVDSIEDAVDAVRRGVGRSGGRGDPGRTLRGAPVHGSGGHVAMNPA